MMMVYLDAKLCTFGLGARDEHRLERGRRAHTELDAYAGVEAGHPIRPMSRDFTSVVLHHDAALEIDRSEERLDD